MVKSCKITKERHKNCTAFFKYTVFRINSLIPIKIPGHFN